MGKRSILFILFIIALPFYVANAENDEFMYQDKVPFGASKTDIMEAFTDIEFADNGVVMTGTFQISLYSCNVSFLMPNDSLALILVEYKGKSDFKEVYERLKSALVLKYGEPTTDAQTQFARILSDPSSIGVFIDKDEKLETCVSWILDDVEIAIFMLNGKVELSYNPTNLIEVLTTGGL